MIQGLLHNRFPFCRFGKPDGKSIVLIPGLTDAFRDAQQGSKMLSRQFSQLAEFFSITVISRPLDCSNSLSQMADELWHVLSHYNTKKINLIGISMGGMLCQHLIKQYPKQFASLSLVVTGLMQDHNGKKRLRRWRDLASEKNWKTLQDETLNVIYGEKSQTTNKSITLRITPPRSQEHFISCVEACLNHNLSESLSPKLIDKVLILGGELDPLYPPDATMRLAAEFDQTAQILSECSHGIVGLTAKKVQSNILQFLQT
ncbi:MAG: alpha/beta hydrolase [bacterium]|nr:alpha/beta hydrolase [bacterium]